MIRIMKKVIAIVAGIVGVWCFVLICDFLTTPPTNESERELARQYLTETTLPTPPRAFTHDGCTLFPDAFPLHNFYDACINHDIGYWAGGDTSTRDAVDLRFYHELKNTGPLSAIFFAPIMYTAVHYFGNNWLSHQIGSNWGFGWNE